MPKGNVIEVKCHHCKGKGKLPLPSHLLVVYNVVAMRPAVTTREVIDLFGGTCKFTTMNNRLTDLYQLGLLSRTTRPHTSGGKEYLWSAKP